MAKMTEILKKMIAQFFYGLFLWTIKSSSSPPPKLMRLKASPPPYCAAHIGLACALCSANAHLWGGRAFHSYTMMKMKPYASKSSSNRNKPPFPPPSLQLFAPCELWNKGTSGDVIGTENGVHISPWERTERKPGVPKRSLEGRISAATNQDLIPPISILRKDGPNYQGTISSGLLGKIKDKGHGGEDQEFERRKMKKEDERCQYLETSREDDRLIINWETIDQPPSSSNFWVELIEEIVEKRGEKMAAIDSFKKASRKAGEEKGYTWPLIEIETKRAAEENGHTRLPLMETNSTLIG